MLKRAFDIVAATAGLIVFAPVLAAVALWIKADSPGPVLYRGRRAGRHGRPFDMLKFRSMVINADKIGGPSTSGTDSRVTRSGRFVRRFKLDELPQLINVVRGEMSLVGPRPEVVAKVEAYTAEERAVLAARPGITDWASLWNCDEGGVLAGAPDADAAYEAVIRPHKMRLQQYYVATGGFYADMRILCFTVLRIFLKSVTPSEIAEYPTQPEMRAEVARFVAATTATDQAA